MEEATPNPGHGNKQQLGERVASPAARNLELTVEAVVEEYVGSFGWSQFLHVLLVSIVWVFDSQNTLVTIFSDAQPKSWRCINNSSSSLCMSSSSRGDVSSVCGLKPGTWEWVGGHESSIVAEWGLVCDRRFLAAVPASMFFIGSLLGSAFFGHLADASLGRKRTVLLSCILSSATAFLTSLSPNIWIYALLRFANGFSRSGIGICCIVLATEVVGRKWRCPVSQYGFFFFTAGFFSLPLIAYPTRKNWRNLYRIISLLPLSYSVLSFPFISESPRWLLVRGRSKEALNVLRKFTRRNGKTLPENLCLANPSNPKEGGENEALTKTCTKESLWRTKWAAKRMITVMIAGFGVGFVYYGVQLNVENLNFNLYFSIGINALMEILAIIFGTILLGLTSRRLLFSLSAFLAGISCLLCIIFTHGKHGNKADKSRDGSWAQLIIEGVGFMVASIAYDVLYIYCVELFPTNVRNFALSQSRLSLMLGASIAPLLVVAGRVSLSLSFLVFGILSIFSGVVSLWLQETKNAPLYDSLKQQEEKEKHRDVGQSNNIQA
ncbi:organic cation/carnitine transporter [Salix suchowensis]|nr:organic cation/carnitine transporter [Salix suchowensis]